MTAQSPKSRSVRHARATPRLRVDPEERAAAGRNGRTFAASSAPRPVRATCRRAARSRGPSRSAPAGRSRAARRSGPGNCTVVASASVSGATSVGREQLAPEREQVVERAGHADPGRAVVARAAGRAAPAPPRAGTRRTASPAWSASVVAEHVEAGFGVDPPLAGLGRSGCRPSSGRPGGVREQVPDGRAGRAGRVVEVDRALLGRDQAGERRHRLRHGRPAELASSVARAPPARTRRRDSDGDMLGRPAPRRFATRPRRLDTREWNGSSSPPARRTSPSRGSRARCASGHTCSSPGTAPVMPDGEELPPGRLRPGEALPRDHRRRARARPALARSTSSARASSPRAPTTSRRSPAPTARSSPTIRPASTYVVTQLLDPRWRVEIEAEALIA